MRTLVIIIWAIILLIFTCASNSQFWKMGELPTFHWSPDPNFHELTDLNLGHSSRFIIQKIGHFLGFSLLGILIYWRSRNITFGIVISVMYAILTEFLQLYFGRDGRIYDVIIDTAGIVLGMLIIKIIQRGSQPILQE